MPEERIRQTLAELGEHPELTEETRSQVQQAAEEAHAGEHEGLKGLIDRLEQRHPQLTLLVGRLAESLAEMGI